MRFCIFWKIGTGIRYFVKKLNSKTCKSNIDVLTNELLTSELATEY